MKCEYCAKEGYGKPIADALHWKIFLAPSQRYLGTCVLANKAHHGNLSELEDHEWREFSKLVIGMETVLKDIFKPTLFNWSCYKNAAYRSENPHPEVHWHLIPRYQDPVNFQRIKYQDPDFGYIPQPIVVRVPENVMENIITEIQSGLKKFNSSEIFEDFNLNFE